jgi:hypothetical protein
MYHYMYAVKGHGQQQGCTTILFVCLAIDEVVDREEQLLDTLLNCRFCS